MTEIDPRIMNQINCFIQTLAPLHPEAAYRIAVVEAYNSQKHVFKGMFLAQAPYYLVFSAKEHPFAAINAGYVMEQLVLYLVSKGFGTCYLGEAKLKPELDHYKPMIVVAFGKPAAAQKKSSDRKKLAELVPYQSVQDQSMRRILDAARLAPSAFNIQPWRFWIQEGCVHIFLKKELPLRSKRIKELDLMGMGIVMCHMALAAEEQWLDWRLAPEEPLRVPAMKGCRYVATLFLTIKEF